MLMCTFCNINLYTFMTLQFAKQQNFLMAMRSAYHQLPPSLLLPTQSQRRSLNVTTLRCSADYRTAANTTASQNHHQLVLEVKQRLEREHPTLKLGKNGRDDEDMILWFLKDRRFSIEEAVVKLSKAIKWREDFGVSGLSEESVKNLYKTGKAYVHKFPDNNGRPVLVVSAAKHFPGKQDPVENEKLCVFLIEKALSKLSPETEEILVIMDLRGFRTENADVLFLKFLIDVFYYYYPRRLGQVLFVDAPFIFQPVWQLAKPLLQSYASLVRFCNAETVRTEYFTESTLPADFKE